MLNSFGHQIIKLNTVDSTNNYIAKLVKEEIIASGSVIMAEHQENGRGQRGTKWQGNPGENLYCSFYSEINFLNINEQFWISKVTAIACYETILHFLPEKKCYIKWPNDILIGKNKTAGILIENSLKGNKIKHCIIGIGINVNQTNFDSGLNATSIFQEKNSLNITSEEVLKVLILKLNKNFIPLFQRNFKQIDAIYHQFLFGLNEEKTFLNLSSQDKFNGTIQKVTADGQLEIKQENSTNHYNIKEIKILL